jgi:hypothetical protein
MVYFFKTSSPKAGQSVRFASSPAKSGRQLLGPTDLKSTVLPVLAYRSQTNTVKTFSVPVLSAAVLQDASGVITSLLRRVLVPGMHIADIVRT